MPHSFGYRARTRDMFKRKFKGARTADLEDICRC
jgi:ribosomal protein L21E